MKQKKSGSARRIVCLVLAAVMLLGLVSSALIIMVNAASSSEIKKELSGLRNQQAELKKEREALQAKIKENQSKTQTLVDKKSDIDQQISMTQASINNLNEQGLTFLCSAGDFDALITGDMAGNTEKKLVERFDLPDIEVLVVGHHGSRYSSTDAFLQQVRPETAIISVGDNSYGHHLSIF